MAPIRAASVSEWFLTSTESRGHASPWPPRPRSPVSSWIATAGSSAPARGTAGGPRHEPGSDPGKCGKPSDHVSLLGPASGL